MIVAVGRQEEQMMARHGFAGWSLKSRRRLIAGAVAISLAGVALGAATSPAGRATAARGTARPAAANAKETARTHYLKAKDLYDAGKYAEAQVENEKALALDPANVDATLMKKVLEGKVTGTAAAGGTSPVAAAAAGKSSVLSPGQISVIKVMELGRGDNPAALRGRIDRPILEEFWNEVISRDASPGVDKSRQAHDAFLNPANFAAAVKRIRDSGIQKYIEAITITSEPAVIMAFRTGPQGGGGVHTYALQNCATSECHGGPKGGNFRLVAGNQPEHIYTNFYILNMYTNKDGQMINRDDPGKSLILQYSLPWSMATAKHPSVDIRKLPNPSDARYQSGEQWIRSLMIPKPNYGIAFEVPTQ
jgi:hypothetical protein